MARRKTGKPPPPSEASLRSTRRPPRGTHRPPTPEELPRYTGVTTLLRLPLHSDLGALPPIDVLLSGVPFDGGANHRSGARFGPRAVREASAFAKPFSAVLGIDAFDELQAADGGDVALGPGDVDSALEVVASRAEVIGRSGIVSGYVGGDHTVTLGALRGIRRAKLKPVGLVLLDAHASALGAALGRRVHHESVVRNAVEEGLVRPDRSIQIGVRGPYDSSEELAFAFGHQIDVATTDDVKWDLHSVVSQIRKVASGGPVYVSVDLGVLDPAYAPGTSAPVPGGLTTWELQQLLRALVGADIVGFDVVELAPAYDAGGITALCAVSVLHEILAAMADTRRSARSGPSSSRGRGGRRSA
jgi:agmatinase